MTIHSINPTTYCIDDGFVRGYLLCGSRLAILIDTCASDAEAKALAESVTNLPVILINTHGDGDHIAGNAAFRQFYMHPADYVNCNVATRCPDSRLLALNDGDVFDIGGRMLEIIAIPGHTYGSIALLDVEERTLYTGDSVQDGHIFMFGAHRQPEAFAASLDKLIAAQARFDRLRAAHGTPELPASYIRTVRDAWQQVLDGKVCGHDHELHGRTVQAFDADGCGFYCN